MMKKIKLTKMIFDYWKYHMCCPVESIEWEQKGQSEWSQEGEGTFCEAEGLSWYDGYNASFWYMLNLSWYEMNSKLFANTFSKWPFDSYLRDFDKDYLEENDYSRP